METKIIGLYLIPKSKLLWTPLSSAQPLSLLSGCQGKRLELHACHGAEGQDYQQHQMWQSMALVM